jgi:hypothetical protein
MSKRSLSHLGSLEVKGLRYWAPSLTLKLVSQPASHENTEENRKNSLVHTHAVGNLTCSDVANCENEYEERTEETKSCLRSAQHCGSKRPNGESFDSSPMTLAVAA